MAWTVQMPSGRYEGRYRDALGEGRTAGTYRQEAQALREAEARESGAVDPKREEG